MHFRNKKFKILIHWKYIKMLIVLRFAMFGYKIGKQTIFSNMILSIKRLIKSQKYKIKFRFSTPNRSIKINMKLFF